MLIALHETMKTKLLIIAVVVVLSSCTKEQPEPEFQTFDVAYNVSGSYPINLSYATNGEPVDTVITAAFNLSLTIDRDQLCGFSSNTVGIGRSLTGSITIDGVTRWNNSRTTEVGDSIVWNGNYIMLP